MSSKLIRRSFPVYSYIKFPINAGKSYATHKTLFQKGGAYTHSVNDNSIYTRNIKNETWTMQISSYKRIKENVEEISSLTKITSIFKFWLINEFQTFFWRRVAFQLCDEFNFCHTHTPSVFFTGRFLEFRNLFPICI